MSVKTPEKPQTKKPRTALSGILDGPQYSTRNTEGEPPPQEAELGNNLEPIEDRRLDRSKQRQQFQELSVAAIRPARDKVGALLNPRSHFDDAYIEELSRSINIHGLLSPITVRPVSSWKPGPKQTATQLAEAREIARKVETMDGYGALEYEIVAGECRWRAAKKAGMLVIPAIIRGDVSDAELAELALIENIRRNNLTVMEEARGFKRCMEFGTKQKDIGEKAGVGQSRISNLVRLLDLPEDVQALLDSGELTAGHGIQLARYKDFPKLCSSLAKSAVSGRWSVKTLEEGLAYQTATTAENAGLIKLLGGYETAFDWKAVCVKDCPFAAYRPRAGAGSGYCLKPDHYKKLQAEAKNAETAKALQLAETQRQRALAEQERAKTAQQEGGTKKNISEAVQDGARAEKVLSATAKGIPRERDLGSCVQIRPGERPEGCSTDCPCALKALTYGDRVVDVCVDPGRLNRLKAEKNRAEQKDRKIKFDERRAQIVARREHGNRLDTRGLALLVRRYLNETTSGKAEAMREVAERVPAGAVHEMLQSRGSYHKSVEEWDALAALPAAELISLVTEIMLRQEMANAYDYKNSTIPMTTWWLSAESLTQERVWVSDWDGRQSVKKNGTVLSRNGTSVTLRLDGGDVTTRMACQVYTLTEDVPAKAENSGTSAPPADDASTSRLFPCADCQLPDIGAFYVDANGEETYKTDIGGAWVCGGCMGKRQAEVAKDLILCSQCQAPLTAGAFDSALAASSLRDVPIRMTSGELLLPDGRAFCDQCGPHFGGPHFAGEETPEPTPSEVDLSTCPSTGDRCAQSCHFEDPCALASEERAVLSVPEVDDWSYQPKADSDEGFCQSCGVIPVHAPAKYCPDCETPSQAIQREREEAVLAD